METLDIPMCPPGDVNEEEILLNDSIMLSYDSEAWDFITSLPLKKYCLTCLLELFDL